MYKILPILLFAYGLAITTEDIYDNSYALIIGIDKYGNVPLFRGVEIYINRHIITTIKPSNFRSFQDNYIQWFIEGNVTNKLMS